MMQAARKLTTEPRLGMHTELGTGGVQSTQPRTHGSSTAKDDPSEKVARFLEREGIETEMLRNGDALSALAGLLESSNAIANGSIVLDELSSLVALIATAVRRTTERAMARM